eukprot:gnl/MRDRNA2_/MRDRNA2_110430_c0_seq1.p1 gnl/MRDRNA2_/MRDRNA2_110430_c0~~gnl/MRDRNA2_/MRDRNA2_110430_c0_seq1.p1  ORF type:complete len:432 (+),score=85.83 gnl/MRDRNA2_/MRDRNA2_110430_c0_seq1:179-1474(+)
MGAGASAGIAAAVQASSRDELKEATCKLSGAQLSKIAEALSLHENSVPVEKKSAENAKQPIAEALSSLGSSVPCTKLEEKTKTGKSDVKILPGQIAHTPMESLERIGMLGQGAVGFVTLVRDSCSKKLYALKAMSKGLIVHQRLKDMVKNEMDCMSMLDSDFIVRLCATYRDPHHVYFLLEPCFGGELFDVYNSNGFFRSEKHAKFYSGCATLGLEHMHGLKIIYRDLKLENCLLTMTGFLKLTDMGIAKVVDGKTFTICGSPDYLAPETLRQKGHDRAVDWWAMGILIFIMMSGRSPFEAVDEMQIYENIIKGMKKVSFPSDMPDQCVSIIHALCQKKPEDRLAMGKLGVKSMRDHPWYCGLSWEDLQMCSMQAPYNPNITEQDVADKIAAKPKVEMVDKYHHVNSNDGSDWDKAFDQQIAASFDQPIGG